MSITNKGAQLRATALSLTVVAASALSACASG